jgi:hypothetical protein
VAYFHRDGGWKFHQILWYILPMNGHESEKWVQAYRSALLELSHAAMAGRLADARDEIAKRIELLMSIPGLHAEERRAIEDALVSLRVLEREDNEHERQRKIADAALEKLRVLEPKISDLERKR